MAFAAMADGSACVLVTNVDKRRTLVFEVGYMRPSEQGGVLVSTSFEEMQHYEEWGHFPTAEHGVRRLIQYDLEKTRESGEQGDEEVGKIRSLEAALGAIPSNGEKINRSLVLAAGSAVKAAVSSMLLVASYEQVMAAVHAAVTAEVLER